MHIEIVEPSVEILHPQATDIMLYPKLTELFGRTCYKSEDKITPTSAEKFCRMLIRRGHESVLEHLSVTVRVVCDRSTSHQIVRHRLNSFSQESQRYCDYGKVKSRKVDDGNDGQAKLKVICPPKIVEAGLLVPWQAFVSAAYQMYQRLRGEGIPPEDARSVLPNAPKTEIVWTCNIRQWRWVFTQRCSKHAQWQVRGLMTELLGQLHMHAPVLFGDLAKEYLGG